MEVSLDKEDLVNLVCGLDAETAMKVMRLGRFVYTTYTGFPVKTAHYTWSKYYLNSISDVDLLDMYYKLKHEINNTMLVVDNRTGVTNVGL